MRKGINSHSNRMGNSPFCGARCTVSQRKSVGCFPQLSVGNGSLIELQSDNFDIFSYIHCFCIDEIVAKDSIWKGSKCILSMYASSIL